MPIRWPLRVAAGLGLASLAACSGESRPAEAQAAPTAGTAVTAPAANKGKTPGPAFHLTFNAGFEPGDNYVADYAQQDNWIATAFDPDNISFTDAGMEMRIEKRRDRGKPYSGSEFQLDGYYGYGRYEAVLKGAVGSGVVTAFFTHTGDYFGDPHDEIDFEFLGRDTRVVQVNYFTDAEVAGAELVNLGFDYTKDFHLYAFEWKHDSIRWFVDGKLIHEVRAETAKVPIPSASGRAIALLWTGAGDQLEWMGKPNYRKASATFRCMSHVPVGQTGSQCSDGFVPPVTTAAK